MYLPNIPNSVTFNHPLFSHLLLWSNIRMTRYNTLQGYAMILIWCKQKFDSFPLKITVNVASLVSSLAWTAGYPLRWLETVYSTFQNLDISMALIFSVIIIMRWSLVSTRAVVIKISFRYKHYQRPLWGYDYFSWWSTCISISRKYENILALLQK